jgi:hypothetical protein
MMMAGGARFASALGQYGASATADVEYYTNVFQATGTAVPVGGGATSAQTGGDTAQIYTVFVNGKLDSGEDSVAVNATGQQLEYHRFDYLSHFEYSANGAANWHAAEFFDLSLNAAINHRMVPFAAVLTPQLIVNTDKVAAAELNFLITPEWRLQLSPRVHDLVTPLPAINSQPAFPDFTNHENIGLVALNYLGITHVTTGLAVSYTKGKFEHIVNPADYDQITGHLTATYKVSDFSSFTGELGYSVRNTEPAGPFDPTQVNANPYYNVTFGRTGAVTGRLAYDHVLSPKTKVDVDVFRAINSYVAGANAQVSTGVDAGVEWKPDFRFKFVLAANYQRDNFQGVITAQNFAGRVDTLFGGNITVKYAAAKWLTFGSHVAYQGRSSNLELANFNGWTFGINATAALEEGP